MVMAQSPPNTSPRVQSTVKPARDVTFFWLAANVVLVVGLEMFNKFLYRLGVPNISTMCPNFTLNFLNLVFTALGTCICLCFGLFEFKRVDILKMLPMSLTFCGFIIFTNLSLKFNNFDTIQLSRVLIAPAIIILQICFYAKQFTSQVKLTVFVVILGTVLRNCQNTGFNLPGVGFALLAVAAASLYLVWVAEKQREYCLNPLQLLLYQAPMSAALLLLVIPLSEPVFTDDGLFAASRKLITVLLVLLSGTVSFCVSASIFWILGNTSPLTYDMLAQVKLSLVVLGGLFVFNDPVNLMQSVGITLSLAGVSAYAYIRMKELELDGATRVIALQVVSENPA